MCRQGYVRQNGEQSQAGEGSPSAKETDHAHTALSHLSTVRLASLSKTVFLTKSLDRTRSRDTRSISDGKCPRISRSGCVRLKRESQNEHIGAMVGSQESQLSGTSDWDLRLFGTSGSLPSLRWFGPSSNFQHRTSNLEPVPFRLLRLNRRHNLPAQLGPNAKSTLVPD